MNPFFLLKRQSLSTVNERASRSKGLNLDDEDLNLVIYLLIFESVLGTSLLATYYLSISASALLYVYLPGTSERSSPSLGLPLVLLQK